MPHTYEQRKQYWEKMKTENPQKYEERMQKERERKKAYYETHKEQIKEQKKAYRETHKEEIKEQQKAYRKSEKGKEAIRRYYKKLEETNPEKYEISCRWVAYNEAKKSYNELVEKNPRINLEMPKPEDFGIKPKKYEFIDDE